MADDFLLRLTGMAICHSTRLRYMLAATGQAHNKTAPVPYARRR